MSKHLLKKKNQVKWLADYLRSYLKDFKGIKGKKSLKNFFSTWGKSEVRPPKFFHGSKILKIVSKLCQNEFRHHLVTWTSCILKLYCVSFKANKVLLNAYPIFPQSQALKK